MAAYKKGEDLFKQKRFVEAEQVFWKEVAEKFALYPVREDALFMTGECLFFQKNYAKAQDKYDLCVKEFSATRHLDEISRRKFEIARIWLKYPDNITASDVKPVNFDDPGQKSAAADRLASTDRLDLPDSDSAQFDGQARGPRSTPRGGLSRLSNRSG